MPYLVGPGERAVRPYVKLYDSGSDGLTFLYGLGIASTTLLVGMVIISILTLNFSGLLLAPVAVADYFGVVRPIKRLTDIDHHPRPAHSSNHMHVSNIGSLIEELASLREQYYQNKASTPASVVDRVELNDAEFEKRIWEIANDLNKLDDLFRLSHKDRTRLGETLTLVRQDIERLREAVDNVTDINVLETVSTIDDKYIDPTMSEIMAASTRTRLQAVRELTAGSSPKVDAPEEAIILRSITGSFASEYAKCPTCKESKKFYVEDTDPHDSMYAWAPNAYCDTCGTSISSSKLRKEYMYPSLKTITIRD